MANKVSTSIVLFKKRAKNNGKYPAKLRVTYNRNQRYFSIDNKERIYEFSPAGFDKITGSKPRGVFKDILLEFSIIEEKARKIIDKLPTFSFDDYKILWGIKGITSNIISFIDERYELLEKEESNQRWSFSGSKKLLLKFFKKEKYIDFRLLTPKKIEEFENWMLAEGYKPSTIATHMGTIRAMFNEAIKRYAIPEEIYPFGKGKYVIKEVNNIKKALPTNEIKAIYNYNPEPLSALDFAKDFWLLTYLGNGMNMVDICRLKWQDVKKDVFTFIRQKTKKKTKGLRIITVVITDDIRRIFEKWATKDKSPDNYVFPFLTEGLSRRQINSKVAYRVLKVNDNLKIICQDLGIDRKITTYSARHSFATTLKRNHVSREFISESLGHANLDITKRYLDSFENEQRQEIAKHLTAF